jgi:hypothetical protein
MVGGNAISRNVTTPDGRPQGRPKALLPDALLVPPGLGSL